MSWFDILLFYAIKEPNIVYFVFATNWAEMKQLNISSIYSMKTVKYLSYLICHFLHCIDKF